MKFIKFLSLLVVCFSLFSCHQIESQETNENQTATPVPALPPLKSFDKNAIAKEILSPAPNFSKIQIGAKRKQAFFNFLTPLVYYANEQILADRAHLLSVLKRVEILTETDKQWLSQLAERYKLKTFDPSQSKDRLMLKKRVDIIPIPLALAQAANETAWGTSRFAKQGNNYFGQWCYKQGCGLVPKQRDEDANHEVKRFQHPFFSVQDYLKNLNTHASYQLLRQIRYQERQQNRKPSAIEMTQGLINYSARKEVYVKALQHMIRYNKLSRFNQYTIAENAPSN
ncbi:glucosaminidase domain-containing protein [Hydrogenovibrio kuenenii]|uniref:glucosaminidase domain-containing protein n=1 Tax=Hydrogenovibrio kuenenii TaxID=63658 RepID=UPI0004635032|nr:glucosaminidase domain-containing protein [Hydrogenovibrio kuenenii]